ncbi:MAG: CHASE2 domain protein [candidate division WS6 bacterium OLB20]|uniref:CHASE2 domain protein n=1 Tax=candidate division WS6 bacterium OLB20 TaxID=1617426 RepID=A0A136M155_9BACT|nr:MAG: CHASE2 domain protein [candidate division WS6 bacterium OLB20]
MKAARFPLNRYSALVAIISLMVFFTSFIGFLNATNNIFLDALQGENDVRSEIVIVGIDDASLAEIGSWPWDRSVFADVIGTVITQDPGVIGIDVLFLEERSGDDELMAVLERSPVPVVFGSKLDGENVLASVFDSPRGFVNFDQDADGKIRKTLPWRQTAESCELSFSLAVMREYLRLTDSSGLCSETVELRSNSFAVEPDGLSFAYSRHPFRYVSIADVYNGTVDPETFTNAIVLIGSTAVDLRSNLNDNFTGVLGNSLPGVEIHANIINSYLTGSFYRQPPVAFVAVSILLVTYAIAWADFRYKRIFTGTALLVAALAVNFAVSIMLFQFGWQNCFIQVLLALLAAFISSIIIKYTLQDREARFVKKSVLPLS